MYAFLYNLCSWCAWEKLIRNVSSVGPTNRQLVSEDNRHEPPFFPHNPGLSAVHLFSLTEAIQRLTFKVRRCKSKMSYFWSKTTIWGERGAQRYWKSLKDHLKTFLLPDMSLYFLLAHFSWLCFCHRLQGMWLSLLLLLCLLILCVGLIIPLHYTWTWIILTFRYFWYMLPTRRTL